MSDPPYRILFIDDDKAMCDLVADDLGSRGLDIITASSGRAGLAALERSPVDVVITDLNMGGMDGTTVCRQALAQFPKLPVIVLTAFGSFETAVEALRAGAYDFLTKPIEMDRLAHKGVRAAEHARLEAEVQRLRREVASERDFGDLIGESPAMERVIELARRVARTDISVLITGETGTGKEVVARAIHAASDRAKGPFVAVNVAALPAELLESELFGHARGAFTGAHRARDGLFVQASGGTLLLDELGEMPAGMQVKLLRALEQLVVRPLGSRQPVPFDARVLASTNRDLKADVQDGRFRDDLYYRLNVVELPLPPLRERGNDVLVLAQHFVELFAERHRVPVDGIHAAAAARLLAHPWPGNIRELKNCIERAVALTQTDKIGLADLPADLRGGDDAWVQAPTTAEESPPLPMAVVERRHIESVVARVKGNRTLAAQILDLDRKTLYRKLRRYAKEDAKGGK